MFLKNNKTKHVPKIIPPRSIVQLVRADAKTPEWKNEIGKRFRIGYYSRQDGLDIIWLVNDDGEYAETINHSYLLKYFKIIRLSKTKNYFGTGCKELGSIKTHGPKTKGKKGYPH